MRCVIRFHGPFRVATGHAARGSDVAVDEARPLPASSVKGAMRATAAAHMEAELVDEVFGTPSQPSPWAWLDVEFAVTPSRRRRVRIAIDDETGTVVEGALVQAEELWADEATFEVVQRARIEADRRPLHEQVLAFAAAATHHLGADRRRGFGWVTVTPDLALPDMDAMRALMRKGVGPS